jgi:serine/threonine protein kinase
MSASSKEEGCFHCTDDSVFLNHLLTQKTPIEMSVFFKQPRLIAKAGTGVVFEVMHKNQKRIFKVLKPTYTERIHNDRRVEINVINEIVLGRELSKIPTLKDKITSILGVYKVYYMYKKRRIVTYGILMNYVEGFDLFHIIDENRTRWAVESEEEFPYPIQEYSARVDRNYDLVMEALDIGVKSFYILKELHRYGIVHRDIKPENIMYDPATQKVTIIDFGFACATNCGKECLESCEGRTGTLIYMHPALFQRDKKVDFKKVDVFSLGLTLLSLLPKVDFPFFDDFYLDMVRSHFFEKYPQEDLRVDTIVGDLRSVQLHPLRELLREILLNDSMTGLATQTKIPTSAQVYRRLASLQQSLQRKSSSKNSGSTRSAYGRTSGSFEMSPPGSSLLQMPPEKVSQKGKRRSSTKSYEMSPPGSKLLKMPSRKSKTQSSSSSSKRSNPGSKLLRMSSDSRGKK